MNKIAKKIFLAGILAVSGSSVALATDGYDFIRTAQTPSFETDFTVAAEKTVNAVVCIKSFAYRSRNYYNQDSMDLFDFFFGPQPRQQPRRQQKKQKQGEPEQTGLGSGVIISDDGYIVTNNHVIDGADKLEVLMNDNSTYEAKIIGTDESTDLALIKIDAKGLSPIVFGNSEDVKIGEWVLAVGNPFGFNSTVTAGIISAKARSLGSQRRESAATDEAFLQTDAALNPGNSGGALVNLKGELIGINTAIYSNTGSYSGFSFAIPTSIVKKVMMDLRQYGTVQRGELGVTIMELDSKIAKEKGISKTKSGLLVNSVKDRSTGKELGLQADDVIVGINGVNIQHLPELKEQLNKLHPGDKVTISFYRDNKLMSKTATLRNGDGDTAIKKKTDFTSLGCAFMKLSEETKEHLGISYGVQVTGLGEGRFRSAGIKDGFIIQSINGETVNSSDDVEYIYNQVVKAPDTDRVMFITGLYPTGKKYYYAVDLSAE